MAHISFIYLWACLCGASPASAQLGPTVAHDGNPQLDSLGWYTVTSAGVLGDKSGPYALSGCVSQSPISTFGYADAGGFCILSGFWSVEFSAGFARNREEVLVSSLKPAAFRLYRNHPNPFRQVTRIAYDIPVRSMVRLCIYDTDGRQVRQLAECQQDVGRYSVNWDGRDKKGNECPAGVYFCSLKTEDHSAVRKMLIAE